MTLWSIWPVVATRHQVLRSPVRVLVVDHALLRNLRVLPLNETVVVPALVRSVIHTTLPRAQESCPPSWSAAVAGPIRSIATSRPVVAQTTKRRRNMTLTLAIRWAALWAAPGPPLTAATRSCRVAMTRPATLWRVGERR